MHTFSKSFFWVFLAAGCQSTEVPSPPAEANQAGLYGSIWGAEVALDAPWRLEPEVLDRSNTVCRNPPCSGLDYGPVPINIVIRDAYRVDISDYDVVSVTVKELGTAFAPLTIPLFQFHEIEVTRNPWKPNQTPPDKFLCRRWQGDTCAGFASLASASEWDASLHYTLRGPKAPGRDVQLELTLNLRDGTRTNTVVNTVSVHLGEPLPRFDDRWVYGDLHYHSEGTDNEGESGYSHRATLQAMSGLGLDFTFATEHASNSGQFDGIEDITPLASPVLRDMSFARWARLSSNLQGNTGANAQIASLVRRRSPTSIAVPQLFLGGEVDVIPEVAVSDYFRNQVSYGNEAAYFWLMACIQFPGHDEVVLLAPDGFDGCDHDGQERSDIATPAWNTATGAPITGRWFLRDVQGPFRMGYFARQHLLHLPANAATGHFVTSTTSLYGGATRRLGSLLDTEYTGQSGVVFLAHPVAAASGSGSDRLGPDLIPYSYDQLDDAFRNQAVLGLQLWNEDDRLHSEGGNPAALAPFDPAGRWDSTAGGPFWGLHHGLAELDRMLLWGVDPARRATVPWLAPSQFRKVFLAGGSDAHGDLNYARKGTSSA